MMAVARQLRSEAESDTLGFLHALMTQIGDHMTFDEDPTHSGTSAAEAFTLKRGVCQDYAHIFIAAARRFGIPARYVSGHLSRPEGGEQEAAHAWAEAYVPELGWTGFDPANGVCPDQTYLRVAVGLDYLDAAPLRGARRGGGQESLSVLVTAREAIGQRQN
jgi:transglutaminase-like putative cysteine protease